MTDIKQYATFLTQSELEHVNDRKLVEQVQNGDTEAFNHWFSNINKKSTI